MGCLEPPGLPLGDCPLLSLHPSWRRLAVSCDFAVFACKRDGVAPYRWGCTLLNTALFPGPRASSAVRGVCGRIGLKAEEDSQLDLRCEGNGIFAVLWVLVNSECGRKLKFGCGCWKYLQNSYLNCALNWKNNKKCARKRMRPTELRHIRICNCCRCSRVQINVNHGTQRCNVFLLL